MLRYLFSTYMTSFSAYHFPVVFIFVTESIFFSTGSDVTGNDLTGNDVGSHVTGNDVCLVTGSDIIFPALFLTMVVAQNVGTHPTDRGKWRHFGKWGRKVNEIVK